MARLEQLRRWVGLGRRSEEEAPVGSRAEMARSLGEMPPWATPICVREHHWILDAKGNEVYANRAAFFVVASSGKIKSQEDYEDTEQVAAYEAETGLEARG